MTEPMTEPMTENTLTVKAAAGLRVPLEDNHRAYITDDAPVEVVVSAYILRRMADGDLVAVQADKPAGAKAKGDK